MCISVIKQHIKRCARRSKIINLCLSKLLLEPMIIHQSYCLRSSGFAKPLQFLATKRYLHGVLSLPALISRALAVWLSRCCPVCKHTSEINCLWRTWLNVMAIFVFIAGLDQRYAAQAVNSLLSRHAD